VLHVRLNEHNSNGLNPMLLRTASAIGEVVVAGLMVLVGAVLGAVALFTFYSLVVTTQDVVTWSGVTVLILAVLLGIGAVRCIQYAVDRAVRRLN
jgi:uncharacterized membrane protein YcjF (UPF0283 family)